MVVADSIWFDYAMSVTIGDNTANIIISSAQAQICHNSTWHTSPKPCRSSCRSSWSLSDVCMPSNKSYACPWLLAPTFLLRMRETRKWTLKLQLALLALTPVFRVSDLWILLHRSAALSNVIIIHFLCTIPSTPVVSMHFPLSPVVA